MMAKPMKTLELHYPVIQFLIKLDRNRELARAVDVMMARAKRIYILIVKVNKLFSFSSSRCFLKDVHVLRVSIEL